MANKLIILAFLATLMLVNVLGEGRLPRAEVEWENSRILLAIYFVYDNLVRSKHIS